MVEFRVLKVLKFVVLKNLKGGLKKE